MRAEEFGRLINNRRTQCGLSKEELARKMKVSPSSVSRIESGEISPTYDTLCRLADALGVEMYELFLPVADEDGIRRKVLVERLCRLPEHSQAMAMRALESILALAER